MLRSIICYIVFPFFLSITVYGQGRADFNASIHWKSDSSIQFNYQATNFGNEQLIHLKIQLVQNDWNWKADSIYLGKGISTFSASIPFQPNEFNNIEDTAHFAIVWNGVKEQNQLKKTSYVLAPRISPWADLQLNDSSLNVRSSKQGKLWLNFKTLFADSTLDLEGISFELTKDTSLLWPTFISDSPHLPRQLFLIQKNEAGEEMTSSFWYENAQLFHQAPPQKTESAPIPTKERKIKFSGSILAESNYFSKRPEHANGSQYPYSALKASNTISIYGIPFTLNAFHSTNQNISPNFRNFFSLQFDVNQFRENIQKQLLEKTLANQYSIPELNTDILSNDRAIAELEKAKKMAEQFPDQDIPFDSLYQKQFEQVQTSIAQDSLIALDSSFVDSIPTASIESNYYKADSALTANKAKIEKIQKAIDRLKQSNELKKRYQNQLKKQEVELPTSMDDPRSLFTKYQDGGIASLLLRFEKIDIGNFYEYAGRYSIRDIEMRGFNARFLLNPNTEINFLTAKINDFQSFNLDRIDNNKKINSVAISNRSSDYFQLSARLTQYKDETIDPELNNGQQLYYLFSLGAEGNISEYAYYEAEINRSNGDLDPFKSGESESFNERSAYYAKVMMTPIRQLDVKLQFDRVGSLYRSDGVYFLNRNMQAYTLGYKLRLFKNKLHIKNDYSIMDRNFEQKELTNRTEKLFFDVGTHFRRLPNIQVSYSPISIELANKLDTSFSGLNANTNVLIARLSYFKKIKKTIITTALIYNEVENEFADEFSTQKGIQHFASISNEKINASFTTSYNKTFQSVRFISANYGQQLTKKFNFNLNFAKNFANHFYSENIRTEVGYQLTKSLLVGAGGIFLIENNSGFVNTGGSVSMRFVY